MPAIVASAEGPEPEFWLVELSVGESELVEGDAEGAMVMSVPRIVDVTRVVAVAAMAADDACRPMLGMAEEGSFESLLLLLPDVDAEAEAATVSVVTTPPVWDVMVVIAVEGAGGIVEAGAPTPFSSMMLMGLERTVVPPDTRRKE